MTEPLFGAEPEEPAPRDEDTLAPGDQVIAIAGRLRGGKAVVVSIDRVPTPSGSSVTIVTINRPRAGTAYAFPHELRKMMSPDGQGSGP